MINVLVQVRDDAAHFGVTIRAESIRQALSIAEARYPGGEPRLVYPIEPEAFFVRDTSAAASVVEREVPDRAAG